MTYSFDIGDVHFVVINTDTLTTNIDNDTKAPHIGWVPYSWIEQDIRKAQADPKLSAIFVIGHKPIMDHPKAEEKAILNTKKHPLGDQLQALFQANNKVRAYLCAHEHLWDCSQLKHAPKVWQVIAGNAGSKLNSKWDPTGGTFFGFSQINIYASGKVGLVNYRRPTPRPPQKYFEGAPVFTGGCPASAGGHAVCSWDMIPNPRMPPHSSSTRQTRAARSRAFSGASHDEFDREPSPARKDPSLATRPGRRWRESGHRQGQRRLPAGTRTPVTPGSTRSRRPPVSEPITGTAWEQASKRSRGCSSDKEGRSAASYPRKRSRKGRP